VRRALLNSTALCWAQEHFLQQFMTAWIVIWWKMGNKALSHRNETCFTEYCPTTLDAVTGVRNV